MKAMILAAGRGERLRPLTDTTPKPLIQVAGKSLIGYHLEKLALAGFTEIIINTAWLAEKIHRELSNGESYGLNIKYSDEGTALETAGGIINALPLLGEEPFLVVNGDIWCDLDFSALPDLETPIQAHLVLVDNPPHNLAGDFSLNAGLIRNTGKVMKTYSGIALFHPEFFQAQRKGALPLAPILREKCAANLVSGQLHQGLWTDVGTPERLQALETQLR